MGCGFGEGSREIAYEPSQASFGTNVIGSKALPDALGGAADSLSATGIVGLLTPFLTFIA